MYRCPQGGFSKPGYIDGSGFRDGTCIAEYIDGAIITACDKFIFSSIDIACNDRRKDDSGMGIP